MNKQQIDFWIDMWISLNEPMYFHTEDGISIVNPWKHSGYIRGVLDASLLIGLN